jgi:hypothetical protein
MWLRIQLVAPIHDSSWASFLGNFAVVKLSSFSFDSLAINCLAEDRDTWEGDVCFIGAQCHVEVATPSPESSQVSDMLGLTG